MSDVYERNCHHGVPRSFTGSGSHCNKSMVDAERHTAFHKVTGHKPPDVLIRHLLLSSVCWQEQGKVLAAGFHRDMLSIVTHEQDWQKLYHTDAVHEQKYAKNGQRDAFARASAHISTSIAEEFSLIADDVNRLWTHQMLLPGEEGFLEQSMHLFHADTPAGALKNYLLEGQDTGERMWVKPLQDGIWYELLAVLRHAKTETLTKKNCHTLIDMLCAHRSRMALCMRQWTPNINDFTESLADHAERKAELYQSYKQEGTTEVHVRPA